MKPCRNMSMQRRPAGTGGAPLPEPSVNRYSHPIRVKGAVHPDSTEELLSYILETLSRQDEQLAELLRRTEGKDTI